MYGKLVQSEANRVASQTTRRTPVWLRTEPEDVQYQILAEMLSEELENISLRSKPLCFPPSPRDFSREA
jgi:hypothetical protein